MRQNLIHPVDIFIDHRPRARGGKNYGADELGRVQVQTELPALVDHLRGLWGEGGKEGSVGAGGWGLLDRKGTGL